GLVPVVKNPEQLQRDAAADGGGERARSDHADLHVARGHRGGDLGPRLELTPVDLVAGGLLDRTVGDRDDQRAGDLLIRDRHFLRLCGNTTDRAREQRRSAEQLSYPRHVRLLMHSSAIPYPDRVRLDEVWSAVPVICSARYGH